MGWLELDKIGAIYEDNRLETPDLQPAASFLRQVTEIFVRSSANFYAEIKELPFIYRELQVHSELLPAIHQIGDLVMVEQAVERKVGRDFSSGRLDYAVRYQKAFVFFIELKFAWIAAVSPGITLDLEDAWLDARDQLKAIPPAYLKEFGHDLGVNDPKKLAKMALLIAPCYQGSTDKDNKLKAYDRTIAAEVNGRLMNGLKKSPPNLSYVWALPGRFQKPLPISEDWNEIYPCVALIARVETLK